jgi:hypothetical protein
MVILIFNPSLLNVYRATRSTRKKFDLNYFMKNNVITHQWDV